jgi:hypothetical protein
MVLFKGARVAKSKRILVAEVALCGMTGGDLGRVDHFWASFRR